MFDDLVGLILGIWQYVTFSVMKCVFLSFFPGDVCETDWMPSDAGPSQLYYRTKLAWTYLSRGYYLDLTDK